MTIQAEGAAVQRDAKRVRDTTGRGITGVIKEQGVRRRDAGDRAGVDRDTGCTHRPVCTGDGDVTKSDSQTSLAVGTGEREGIAPDLRQQEGTADRAAEGDVAARRTAAGGVDPIGSDAGGSTQGKRAADSRRGGGIAVDQGAERVAGGREVTATRAGDGEELRSGLAIQIEH